jgi:transposase-like protein
MKYTRQEKAQALELLRLHSMAQVHRMLGIPVSTLRRWLTASSVSTRKTAGEIDVDRLACQIAEKAMELITMMDHEQIQQASLHQVAGALGVLIDRYLKLRALASVQQQTEKVIRIEYLYPDNQVANTPPWAELDSQLARTLQSGGLWQAFRQDGSRPDHGDRTDSARQDGLVAGSDLPHGGSGLARPETALHGSASHPDEPDGTPH